VRFRNLATPHVRDFRLGLLEGEGTATDLRGLLGTLRGDIRQCNSAQTHTL
jgi:hypothetical protein